MNRYVIDLPDSPYLTPNSRAHWTKRASCARVWREKTAWLAVHHKIPALGHALVALEMHPKDRRRRDADNLVSGVLKHCLDGLVDAGVIPDDTPEHVTSSMPTIVHPGPSRDRHRWVLVIEGYEVPDAA